MNMRNKSPITPPPVIKSAKGFTLAEVLIALTIIGIIAAITIPSILISTQRKELESAFKKQYSSLKQAIAMLKFDDGLEFTYDNYGSKFKTKLAGKYNVMNDCGSIDANTGCILQDDDGTFSYYKSYSNNTLNRDYFDDGGFLTIDGILFLIEQGTQSEEATGYLVTIDVNGYSKKPNKMGYDLFMFQITEDGDVLPMGDNGTYYQDKRSLYCSKSSSSPLNGFTCAYYAATDKDYFQNL